MRRFVSNLWKALRQRAWKRPGPRTIRRPLVCRLECEGLEDRAVPTVSATASGSVIGRAFIDSIANNRYDAGEAFLPGATVTLTGTTYLGKPLTSSAVTNSVGIFSIVNVPNGTYRLVFAKAGNFGPRLGGALPVTVANGKTVALTLPYAALGGAALSMRNFLTNSPNGGSVTLPKPGGGTDTATGPVIKQVANQTFAPNTTANPTIAKVLDLAGAFTAPDIANSQVRINTNHGSFNMTLFDTTAPQTVANFFDYINSGNYNNSIFHRLGSLSLTATPKQVLQGGGAEFVPTSSGGSLTAVPNVWPALTSGTSGIPNEFGASNLPGTIAMAQSSGANSGTNQFFFNLINNSTLDAQKFAVFGKVSTAADMAALTSIINAPTQNLSLTGSPADTSLKAQNAGVGLGNVPLFNYPGSTTTFANDTQASNFLLINSITVLSRPEVLTYSLVSNDNTNVVTASLTDERLSLTPLGTPGKATITVKATDQYGSSVTQSFTVFIDTPPTATLSLNKTAPNPGDSVTVTAVPSGSAVTNPQYTFTYEWQVNGKTVQKTQTPTASTTDTLMATNLKPGDKIVVKVTTHDGILDGAAVTQTATVNSVPVVSSLQVLPASPAVNATLTATANTTGNFGAGTTLTFVWSVNGVTKQTHDKAVTPSTPTTDTLDLSTLTGVSRGQVVKVTVTPKAGTATGTAVSHSVTLVNGAPTATSVSLDKPSPLTTDTLTATVNGVSDADGDPVKLTYVWQVNGTTVKTTTATSNTTDTLDLTPLNVHSTDHVTVQVTPSDGTLSGAAVSATAIVNSAPIANTVSLAPTNPGTNDTLTATVNATDADGDTISLTYVWKVDGVIKQTNTTTSPTQTFDLSVAGQGDRDQVITVEVTPNDGKVNGALKSATTTVVNTPPTAGVTFDNNTPAADATLTAIATAVDADGDPVTVTYVWMVNNSIVRQTNASSLLTDQLDLTTVANLQSGAQVTCTVTPNDGTVDGTSVTTTATVA